MLVRIRGLGILFAFRCFTFDCTFSYHRLEILADGHCVLNYSLALQAQKSVTALKYGVVDDQKLGEHNLIMSLLLSLKHGINIISGCVIVKKGWRGSRHFTTQAFQSLDLLQYSILILRSHVKEGFSYCIKRYFLFVQRVKRVVSFDVFKMLSCFAFKILSHRSCKLLALDYLWTNAR